MHAPRDRRSPCETDCAAAKHGGKGTVENGRARVGRSISEGRRGKGTRLCRDRPMRLHVRRYGSHRGRATKVGPSTNSTPGDVCPLCRRRRMHPRNPLRLVAYS